MLMHQLPLEYQLNLISFQGTIELNGVIPVTGITSPKMTANAYGLLSPTEVIALPICLSTAITPGEIKFARPNVTAGANKITTIKSSPSGTFSQQT